MSTADFHQQLAASSLCDAESLKAFHQMYNGQNSYAAGFDKNYPAAAFPFFAQHFAPYTTPSATTSFSPASSSASSTTSQNPNPTKKKPVPVPPEEKDEHYYERRKRNNLAARKSREARKKQDTDNSVRVAQLETENLQLRAFIHQLYAEIAALKQRILQQSGFAAPDPSVVANIPNY